MVKRRFGLGAGIFLAALSIWAGVARAEAPRPLVVVELFTSQGCSSCPPADAYLADLTKRADVLPLAFHIDYWNYIGWVDPFATKETTQRQRDYAKALALRYVYTPQMVVNGSAEGVGSERGTIERLIEAARQAKREAPSLSLEKRPDSTIVAYVGPGTPDKPATLWLVTFDPQRATKVLRGENGGRMATDYQVVRSIRSVGTWTGKPAEVPCGTVSTASSATPSGTAVLLQTEGPGPILAAAVLR